MNNLIEEQLMNTEKRVEFKRHFLIYVVVIVILWVVWAVRGSGYMWPVWPTVGWGVGIIFHFIRMRNNTLQNEI